MFLEIFIQMLPYLAVFAVLGYIGRIQQKKAKEREEEQKKGIIRTCYVLKTEKILTIFFIVAVVLWRCNCIKCSSTERFITSCWVWYFFYYCFNRNSKYDNVET